MVQQMCNQRPCSLIADLAAVETQDAEVVSVLDGLGQQLAVRLGEVKQIPLKVHPTVVDTGQKDSPYDKGEVCEIQTAQSPVSVSVSLPKPSNYNIIILNPRSKFLCEELENYGGMEWNGTGQNAL